MFFCYGENYRRSRTVPSESSEALSGKAELTFACRQLMANFCLSRQKTNKKIVFNSAFFKDFFM